MRSAIDPARLIARLEEGFAAYSEGRAIVPPVGHLSFDDPPGDCHIKYGFIQNDEHFVVKVATGFYHNADLGLSSSNGLMIVLNRKTGYPEAVLLDEGWLTDVRTAATGAVAAKYLAPHRVTGIGIVGTGIQARLQLEWLRQVILCSNVNVWGRDAAKARRYRDDMGKKGFSVDVAPRIEDLCEACNLIVTATPSCLPLLHGGDIRSGTHITAVGADGGGKQELAPDIFGKADVCVVDSLAQCRQYGDASFALQAGMISAEDLIELGRVIRHPELGRKDDSQITVADLTGVAVQDIQIARLVTEKVLLPS
jgi:ornithine cyclodeaminase